MTAKAIRIEAPHFVAAIDCYCIDNPNYNSKEPMKRKIHRCAPIIKYMSEWTIGEILRYCKKKNWKCEFIGEI